MVTAAVRVGWLGAGLIATFHSKMLRGSGVDATWAGVFDPDRERAERFAAASGATAVGSVEEVLDGCDAVYVCTWTAAHLELVTAAAERGVAVFCEKPLSTDLPSARRLVEVVEDAGIVNQVGLILRRSPAYRLAARLLSDDERAGRVMSFVFRDDQHIPTRGLYASSWRGDVALAGSGTLLEHSIHDVDLLEQLVGPIASVAAHEAFGHALDGIEDVVSASIELVGGAVGSLTSVWHDIDARPSLRRLEVFCERRHVVVENDWFGPLTWTDDDGSARTVEGAELLELAATHEIVDRNPDGEFVEAVAAGRAAWPTVRDALRAHEVVDAIYRSCATERRERP